MIEQRPSFERYWREKFYEFAQKNEDDAGIAGWSPSGLQTRYRFFVRSWAGSKPNSRWLDSGCGAGTYTRFLRQSGVFPFGLDYSFLSLTKAHQQSFGEYLDNWICGDVNHLPIRPSSMEGVICFGVTQALSHSNPAVRELTTVVRSGGEVWLDGLNKWCLANIFQRIKISFLRKPIHLRYESPALLKRQMQRNGLYSVKFFWLPIMPPRLQRFQRLFETRLFVLAMNWIPLLGALISHSFVLRGIKHRSN